MQTALAVIVYIDYRLGKGLGRARDSTGKARTKGLSIRNGGGMEDGNARRDGYAGWKSYYNIKLEKGGYGITLVILPYESRPAPARSF